ncbi:MAG TPA: sigma factor [Acidimicrobiales bacterium]|nr:sigma factor [Acidimicrobiales bacterium]
MADPTDAALVAAARDGDKTSFTILLERHRPLLDGLCQRTLGNQWSAEDAVQEASLQALLGLGHPRHPERFGPWLAGIGLNVCRRMLRQRRFEMWTAETLSGGRSGHEPPDSEPGPEELAGVADVARRVREAVAALPADRSRTAAINRAASLSPGSSTSTTARRRAFSSRRGNERR